MAKVQEIVVPIRIVVTEERIEETVIETVTIVSCFACGEPQTDLTYVTIPVGGTDKKFHLALPVCERHVANALRDLAPDQYAVQHAILEVD